jgi:hypothetical protein
MIDDQLVFSPSYWDVILFPIVCKNSQQFQDQVLMQNTNPWLTPLLKSCRYNLFCRTSVFKLQESH